MMHRRFGSLLAGVALAFATGLVGCSGNGSGSGQQQSQGSGPFGLFGPRRDPNADLTPAEGRKLVAAIQKDRKRLQKLTPAERRFLAATADAESQGE